MNRREDNQIQISVIISICIMSLKSNKKVIPMFIKYTDIMF